MHPFCTEPVIAVRLDDLAERRDLDFIRNNLGWPSLAVLLLAMSLA